MINNFRPEMAGTTAKKSQPEKKLNEEAENRSKSSEDEDKELVRKAQAGDDFAFGRLVEKYQRRIYSLAWNMTGNHSDADDLAQEVFLKCYRAIGSFRFKSAFYTWLYRIAVNTIITRRKQIRRDTHLEFQPASLDISGNPYLSPGRQGGRADRSLVKNEIRSAVREAIDSLPEKHRAVVVMHELEGLTHAEIGKILSCSEGTVRSRLHYARKKLKNKLGAWID